MPNLIGIFARKHTLMEQLIDNHELTYKNGDILCILSPFVDISIFSDSSTLTTNRVPYSISLPPTLYIYFDPISSQSNHREISNFMAIINMFNPSTSLEAECDLDYDYDDDAFYAELRRQILLLTDDEELPETQHSSPVRHSRLGVQLLNPAVPSRSCFRWGEGEISGGTAPAWLLKPWGNGGGTGVFIPHAVKPRRVPGTYYSFFLLGHYL